MSLEDPLEPFRLGPAEDADDLESMIASGDQDPEHFWRTGGSPVALTGGSLYFVQDEVAYRVRRGEVQSFGLTRSSSTTHMRWGLALYLLGLPMLLFVPPLALVMALVGGYFVTKGFLGKAILVQVKDERLPPFVIETRKWKPIRKVLRQWR